MVSTDDTVKLIIRNTEPNDSAKYRCVIANKLGRDESEAKLSVIGRHCVVISENLYFDFNQLCHPPVAIAKRILFFTLEVTLHSFFQPNQR